MNRIHFVTLKDLLLKIWLFLCISHVYGIAVSQQESEGAVLDGNLEDLVRRLSQQQHLLQLASQPLRRLSPSLPDFSPDPGVRFPGNAAHSFASSYASAKRPYSRSESEAAAFASVRDVNNAERLEEDMDYARSSIFGESEKSRATLPDTASTVSGHEAPFTLKRQQVAETVVRKEDESFSDVYFVAIVAGCCAVGIFGVISAGFCFYKLQKSRKAAADVDYPAYGVTGPCKDVTSPNGDRKLAQSAQMYHYQHQKQQMIAVEKAGSTKNTSASDVESEEENEEGDYTVYECPGLAPASEMEVKNPLFHDDNTPVSPTVLPQKSDSLQSN